MRAYSIDLRKRIVKAIEEGESQKAVAERYQVCRWTVNKFVRLYKEGNLEPKKHPGQPAWLSKEDSKKLKKQVEKYPDLTLDEHSDLLYEKTGLKLARSTMHKYLDKMNLSLKKRLSEQKKQIKN